MKSPKLKKGLFITFEGIEGSGKTTQIKALERWFRQKFSQRELVLTREPGGTPLADKIRGTLLHGGSEGMTPDRELFLYEVARRDHVQEVIQPALARHAIVLCDRFTDATLAYQGYARGLSLKKIEYLNQIATGGLVPDVTFLFDLPVSEGLSRINGRKKKLDRLDRESESFHQKVRRGYLAIAKKNKKRFRIIQANRSQKDVFNQLCREMEKVIRK